MSSSSSFLPDFTTLWAQPVEPHFPAPPSPPRRGASSAHDARRAAHEQALRNVARARSVYHHSIGSHLPSRSCAGSSGGSSSSSRARVAPVVDGNWKDQVKLHEADAGYAWNGSSITEQEERELSDEEETRMVWRDNVLSYGRSSLVVLGRGKTMAEEAQELDEREAMAAAAVASGNVTAGNITNVNGGAAGPAINWIASRPGRRDRATERGRQSEEQAGGAARGGGGEAGTVAAAANNGPNANTAGVAAPMARMGSRRGAAAAGGGGGGGGDISLMAEDQDVYQGEYTLDDGDDDADDGDPRLRGRGGREVDLDAGMESMD